ncbi:MAG TPA: Pr6Pr family membrane protein [Pyrinomonadaceae bacterium]|nr:Pr6Pr family membrane protein [Pyrinomonadaceae bacterium]
MLIGNRKPAISILIVGRLIFSLLTLIAIAAQLVVHIRRGFSVVIFFSYFANLSNLFVAVVMLVGAIHRIQYKEPKPWEDLIRGASVAGMAVVGIVFSILLRNEDMGSLMPWVNTVLHYIMPLAAVADWFFKPPKSQLTLSQIPYWLIFPLLYLLYTLIRGSIVGFYPYPFINPANVGGYPGVALYSLGIIGLFVVVSALLIALGNKFKAQSSLV